VSRDALAGLTVALVIITAPGLAGMLGQWLTGVPDPISSSTTPAVSGEELLVWSAPKPRVSPREASRSRTPGRVGTGSLLNWHALALCESSDNPTAVSSSGRYRGLYQFDLTTWRSVGGSGDPAAATRTEQTHRARLLYAVRGAQPWPECGGELR